MKVQDKHSWSIYIYGNFIEDHLALPLASFEVNLHRRARGVMGWIRADEAVRDVCTERVSQSHTITESSPSTIAADTWSFKFLDVYGRTVQKPDRSSRACLGLNIMCNTLEALNVSQSEASIEQSQYYHEKQEQY